MKKFECIYENTAIKKYETTIQRTIEIQTGSEQEARNLIYGKFGKKIKIIDVKEID